MKTEEQRDPYAPPPRYRDSSGALVRGGILAVLLAGAAWGYMSFASNQDETASLVEPPSQEQQVADAGYRVAPSAPVEDVAPLTEPAPTPAPRAPAPPVSEPTAPPASTSVAPAPLPGDVPPAD